MNRGQGPAVRDQRSGVSGQESGGGGRRPAVSRFSSFILHPLSFILLIFTALVLYNSIVLPLGEAADETDHYQYLRFVARSGHPPLTGAERDEAGFKGGLAPLYYWLTAWPIALVGEETRPDIRRVDSRPERHIPTDGLGINHVMHTLDEQWPWRGQPLAWHLVRLLSIPMGWVTIIATYALARRLAPGRKIIAVLAAGFVAFLPRFIMSSAVINDDNLVFALIALLLLVETKIIRDDRPSGAKMMAALGTLFGLAVVAKYFSLILIPTVALTLTIAWRKTKAARTQGGEAAKQPAPAFMLQLLTFSGALFLCAGLWFIFIILRFNRIDDLGLIPGLAASLGEPQITEGLAGLLSGQSVRPPAATYSLLPWFSLLYRSFWFEFGWMQLFAPTWVYVLFSLFSLLAIIGLIRLARQKYQLSKRWPTSPVFWLLALHLGLFVFVVLIRYILSATIDTGQGRHLYPALPVMALLTAAGIDGWRGSGQASGAAYQPSGARRHAFRITYLLPVACFLLPALISLSPALNRQSTVANVYPSRYISPHYDTLPVTSAPVTTSLNLEFAPGLSLAGLETETTVEAGDALPVTLAWQAKKEAAQDYLVSLCLHDDANRPAACWRGHFDNGRYPARVWEMGDTLLDTVYIPIPVCFRLLEQPYTLNLGLWPLDPTRPDPIPMEPPVLEYRFDSPLINITPTDSLKTLSQTAELWRGSQRLNHQTSLTLNESLGQITYASHNPQPQPVFSGPASWMALFDTPLHLPCTDGPQPFAHLSQFVVDSSLPAGGYQPNESFLPGITLSTRSRSLVPISSTLTFSHTLAPLTIDNSQLTTLPLPITELPVTIQWQAHRFMADPLIAALKLLDKDFNVGGQRIATLGDRYPNVLWAPTELVEETYPLQIEPDTPAGLYRLELGILRQDDTLPAGYETLPVFEGDAPSAENLYPATIRLLDPAHNTPPDLPLSAQLGNAIHLTGYSLESKPPISLALYWESTAKIPTDYTVFTQLIGPDGQVWAQWDNPPQAGRYPTSAWTANDRVVDRYNLILREGAPAGRYRLLVGMYNPASGDRLPATLNGQPQPDNAIELTTISVTP